MFQPGSDLHEPYEDRESTEWEIDEKAINIFKGIVLVIFIVVFAFAFLLFA